MDKRKKRKDKYRPSQEDIDKKNLKNSIIPINETMLDIFCAYSVSRNVKIHKYALTSMYNLMTKLASDHFKSQSAAIKLRFLMKVLHERIHGIYDRNLLLASANNDVDVAALAQDPMFLRELNDAEINFVERSVSEFLNLTSLFSNLKDLKEQIIGFEEADMRDRTPMLQSIRSSATELLAQFRKNDINQDSSDTIFRLSTMSDNVSDIHKQVTGPTFKLKTGMQGLNALLGGGLEQGNVYCFFGLPGEGKTITIENLLYQVWKYNRGYECRDKTKRPAIVLLTMENFVRQTVCALYNIITHKNMRDCATAEEAIAEFRNHAFEFRDDDNNAIEIVIKFKPVNSVTTDYCSKLIEDLGDEGYEVICFFQDYLKRILPVLRTNDPYQDLGNITNEFKTIATLNRIPFVTVSQLNREAAKVVDEGRNANKTNLIQRLGRGNIGESSRIDENLDGTFIISPEMSTTDNKKYLGIKNTKHRYEIDTRIPLSIYQPFREDSPIALEEDIYLAKPVFKDTLSKSFEDTKETIAQDKVSINRNVRSLEQLTAESMMHPGVTTTPIPQPQFRKTPPAPPPPPSKFRKSSASPNKEPPEQEYESWKKMKPLRTVIAFVDKTDENMSREKLGIPDYNLSEYYTPKLQYKDYD